MPTVAEVVDVVIGVDTHTDTHTLALANPAGAVLAETTVVNTAAGHAEALSWAVEHAAAHAGHATAGRLLFAVEGTRSHGIGLTRVLLEAGQQVLEVERPRRASARQRGKSDVIDARAAARAALGYDTAKLPTPRADGDREALRLLLGARTDLSSERTAKINRLQGQISGLQAKQAGTRPQAVWRDLAGNRGELPW